MYFTPPGGKGLRSAAYKGDPLHLLLDSVVVADVISEDFSRVVQEVHTGRVEDLVAWLCDVHPDRVLHVREVTLTATHDATERVRAELRRRATPESASAPLREAVAAVSRDASATAARLRGYARDFTTTGRRRVKLRETRRVFDALLGALRAYAPGLDPETVGRVVAEAFADVRGLDVFAADAVFTYYGETKRRDRKASRGTP